jgi:hypothetical protein
MSWSFNASGVTGDIEAVKRLIGEIRDVLSKPEYGTGSSQVSSDLGLVTNFHADAPAAPAAEAEETAAEAETGVEGQDSGETPPE